MDLAAWSRVVRQLGTMDRCSAWWVGDCIRYGNTRFGERYSRVASLTGYDVQTLMNRVYVASRISISRRRETLSWSHHAEVAPLAPAEQDAWLTRAVVDRLSVADLRTELRSARRAAAAGEPDPEVPRGDTAEVCPHCGGRMGMAAGGARRAGDRV